MKSNSSATSRAPAGPWPCPCPSARHQPPSTLLCQTYMCTLRLSHAPLPPLALHRTASHRIASLGWAPAVALCLVRHLNANCL
ncbi:GM19541 [Drosophila sechellia]|uniref:GM19541 n=1 Tax=Drosophila sechellia TaxID=7238 RepID=B4HXS3_DROSE|nr:GM19541 [Drosophila sechellia]